MADGVRALSGEDALAFFDAIAPIVHREFIDFDIAWFQSRYNKAGPGGTGADYINCPLTREQYDAFIDALLDGEKISFRDFEAATPYFDGCLPIEVMAERGRETLRHGPMKPFGLTDPHKPAQKPYAVVQLRQDNKLGTLFNMVGFQTKLKHSDQVRIFRTIPSLGGAEFARLGGLHRNTFLNSPKLLDATLRLGRCRGCALPGRSPDARATSSPRRVGSSPGVSPDGSASARMPRYRHRRQPMARCSPTSPEATSRRSIKDRRHSNR